MLGFASGSKFPEQIPLRRQPPYQAARGGPASHFMFTTIWSPKSLHQPKGCPECGRNATLEQKAFGLPLAEINPSQRSPNAAITARLAPFNFPLSPLPSPSSLVVAEEIDGDGDAFDARNNVATAEEQLS